MVVHYTGYHEGPRYYQSVPLRLIEYMFCDKRGTRMSIRMNKKGITLMEVLVASIIFALVMIGVANLFVGGKRYILHARSRMTGGELGRYFLDPLQVQVRQDEWGTNNLSKGFDSAGIPSQWTDNRAIDKIRYNVDYTAENAADTETDVRKVTATVSWTETAPSTQPTQ